MASDRRRTGSRVPERPKVVVTNRVHREVLDMLEARCRVVANDRLEPWSRRRVLDEAADAEALIAFMNDAVDEAFLQACPRLKVVACALKGYDNFDVAACTRHGVWVTIVPDLLTEPTAELAIGLMIALGRHMLEGDRLARSGAFEGWRPVLYGRGLAGSTVGIVGMGAVGRAVAARVAPFGARILYHDRTRLPRDEALALGATAVTFDELLVDSDYVVLGLPLTPETHRLIDAAVLARMRPGALLINPARGSLVDEAAVAAALEDGRLGGYAADVFEMEDWSRPDRPSMVEPRLAASPRTVLTPHIGSAVDRVRCEIAAAAARSALQALSGMRPEGAVNEPAGTGAWAEGDGPGTDRC